MSNVLTTFSGRFGDILWSLPTVRAVSQMVGGERVDFGIMPAYRTLLPLLSDQPYIRKAFVIENWLCEGSPFGDQPWQPPKDVERDYERCFHLTYRCHPGIHRAPIPLIDFTAEQQGIELRDPIPFIEAADWWDFLGTGSCKLHDHIAFAFNAGSMAEKVRFLEALRLQMEQKNVAFVDVSGKEWCMAAAIIRDSLGFVGCRSSNNVLAHGVGQKNIFIYEPESSRHAHGPLGKCFGSPYTEEKTHPLGMPPEQAAALAAETISSWQEQIKVQETTQ